MKIKSETLPKSHHQAWSMQLFPNVSLTLWCNPTTVHSNTCLTRVLDGGGEAPCPHCGGSQLLRNWLAKEVDQGAGRGASLSTCLGLHT